MSELYYDAGSGWTPSSIPGSIMIRPVVGRKIIPPVGIKELEMKETDHSFVVYPNPADNTVILESIVESESTYQLTDIMGRIIKEENNSSNKHFISTHELQNGIYFLHILTGKEKQTRKVVIQR